MATSTDISETEREKRRAGFHRELRRQAAFFLEDATGQIIQARLQPDSDPDWVMTRIPNPAAGDPYPSDAPMLIDDLLANYKVHNVHPQATAA